jgi:hypothetical protein
LFALGMIRVLFDIAGADTHTLWAALAILIVYGAALGLRGVLARVQTTAATLEGQVRVVLLIGATALLSALLADAFGARLATFVWALQGAALLFAGFLVRERALRLLGLLLLFVCIFKLFVYDLRELEALARIMSFVALGLVLLGVSWVYTRYREDIRKLL